MLFVLFSVIVVGLITALALVIVRVTRDPHSIALVSEGKHRHLGDVRRGVKEEARIWRVVNDEVIGEKTVDITDYLKAGRR